MAQQIELSTTQADGKRIWVFPSPSKGFWTRLRKSLAALLVLWFLLAPWLQLNGKPWVFVDILHRRIDFLGFSFFVNETPVFLASIFLLIGTILLITSLLGRFFCGWICPHTVFMEFVYRPIERILEGFGSAQKIWKQRALSHRLPRLMIKWLVFFSISFVLANSFLAYFLGSERLIMLIKDGPLDHFGLFATVVIVASLFTAHFGWFREQLCLFVCPYGRLQSILIDKNSLIVAYDKTRGEPRGKLHQSSGDCIDCKACVRVCPTGIDIREGLQLECVQCTACIDACDEIMSKISKPKGLIRYQTENEVEQKPAKILRPRVIGYSIFVVAFLTLLIGLTGSRSSFSAVLNREFGRDLFYVDESIYVTNPVRIHFINRLDEMNEFQITAHKPSGLVITNPRGEKIKLQSQEKATIHVLLRLPRNQFSSNSGVQEAELQILDKNNNSEFIKVKLFGPIGSAP